MRVLRLAQAGTATNFYTICAWQPLAPRPTSKLFFGLADTPGVPVQKRYTGTSRL